MHGELLISINNPILKNHTVYGRELLPGLAYVDMLYQFFRERGYDYRQLELGNVSFYHPLTVEQDCPVMLGIECLEDKEGHWKIRVEGRKDDDRTPASDKKLYITAEMRRQDPVAFEETLDLNAVKQSAGKIFSLEEVYDECRRHELIHTGFMKAQGKIYETDTAIIMEVSVGHDALSGAADFMFHPTLIDGSGTGTGALFGSPAKKEQQLYLPLFYQSFRASALLQKQCIARIPKSAIHRKKELTDVTMEFFDETGKKVAEFKKLMLKLVREPGLINPHRKKNPPLQKRFPLRLPDFIHPNTATKEPNAENPGKTVEAEAFLRQLLAERLKRPADQIHTQVGYYEMGLDSPGLLEIVKTIEMKTGISLSPTLLFEYTTIAELAAYLTGNYAAQFGRLETAAGDIRQEAPDGSMTMAPSDTVTVVTLESTIPEDEYQPGNPMLSYPETLPARGGDDIAIIGMAGRYPGASNLREFWNNLKTGRDCIREIPDSRWDWQRFKGLRSPSGKAISHWGGFIDEPDCFDPHFFRIAPREAEIMDPQERLFLEICWETIEDAGYTPKTMVLLQGPNKRMPVGVFAGVMHKDYTLIEAETVSPERAFPLSLNCAQIANRVSYFCNFHGPSIAVDTVCSSSLTAVHLALESIRRGECEVALAGGVNLSLHPNKYLSIGMMDMHASDGYCHTFGKGGDGYVSGEGIGAVLLKPLSRAIQDRDHIYAVIKGSSINHGGTVSGITVPSPVAQADMILSCLEKAGVDSRTISYVEAHGTGTSLGDPIEIEGLVKAYRHYTQDRQFCAIGSVKSNVGHAESAAGICGLHKAALQLYHKILVPTLHSEELNPYIDFPRSPFYLQHQTEEWKQPVVVENGRTVNYPRRAGLSSFGATGSNAHIILEEYNPGATQSKAPAMVTGRNNRPVIVPLSAKNKNQLQAYVRNLLDFLRGGNAGQNRRPSQAEREMELREILAVEIRGWVAGVLQVNEQDIEFENEWNEYGIEPVQLMKIKDKIQSEYEIELGIQELNRKSSIASVNDYLCSYYRKTLEARLLRSTGPEAVSLKESEAQAINSDYETANLADLAYTLQVGREAMEERVAFVAGDIPELIIKLESFGEDKAIDHCWRGQVKHHKETIDWFNTDQDSRELIDKWMLKGNVSKIAELWVKGLKIDWNKFYEDTQPEMRPRRVSLPTYPFAKESYWIPERYGVPGIHSGDGMAAGAFVTAQTTLHPLVHQNTSDLSEQRFSSTFTGREAFFTDHGIKGRRMLPPVACLEIAQAAVEMAFGSPVVPEEELNGLRLKNVAWNRPVVVEEQPVRIHTGIFPEDSASWEGAGEVAYEIYGGPDQPDADPVVYCQGRAVRFSLINAPVLDLEDLKERCGQRVLSSGQYYEELKAREPGGLEPGYPSIEMIYMGPGRLLAKFSPPSHASDMAGQLILDPNLIESALQASTALMMGTETLRPVLPLTLLELEIYKKGASVAWALIQNDGDRAGDQSRKLNIDFCDHQGNVRVRMKGLEIQAEIQDNTGAMMNAAVTRTTSENALKTQEAYPMMTFEELWQEHALADIEPVKIKTVVCLVTNPENQRAITKALQTFEPDARVIFIAQGSAYQKHSGRNYGISKTDRNSYIEAFMSIREDAGVCGPGGEIDAVLYLWALEDPGCIQDYSCIVNIIQSITAAKLKPGKLLLAGQFGTELDRCYLESWIGFERSLGLILPHTRVAAIYQESRQENRKNGMRDWVEKLWAELQAHQAQSVLYQKGKRYVYQIRPSILPPGKSLLRPGGTYLITGGCGGLGHLFAEYFAKLHPVNLILTGRSAIDTGKETKIKALEDMGSRVMYIQSDVCDPIRMKDGLNLARKSFGSLNGVIHAAGLESRQNILERDFPSFQKVLDPKIKGTLVLDELVDSEPLDFICYFSSSAAVLGDFGSCDYAVGNRFQMAYAHYRNQRKPEEKRRGKAIVINWPLWKDGGMGLGDDENNRMYLKTSGQRSLETGEGLAVFDRILAQDHTQHLILAGEPDRIQRFLGLDRGRPVESPAVISSSQDSPNLQGNGRKAEMKGWNLKQCLEWDLKQHIGKLLKIPSDKLNDGDNLADFGFDSISLAEFAALLTGYYGIEISPALFFGYATIEKLCEYYLSKQAEVIREFYREDTGECVTRTAAPTVLPATAAFKRREAGRVRFITGSVPQSVPEPIAIIGMSGRFPEARNIEEMWAILATEQDVVKEIPADRFPGRGWEKDRWKCGWLPGVSEFDPLFFEIAPRDAEIMDPRQRLLLQESWKALEDAGYGLSHIRTHKIGMFVGAEAGEYQFIAKEENGLTSNHDGVLAARLAYFLNLSGPVMAINTACSSGLVAAHQAILSLRSGECDTAIAAGVNLMLTPEPYAMLSQAGMLSEDGKCFAFDKRANGMVPGEAVAVVVLKRLSKAEADGDPVYAVIQGSGINYDGKTNGITAPSGVSQTNLLKSVYDQSKVDPGEIEYIVTHGTGTKLGDPVEINALYDVFKDYTQKQGYCALTSVKTNFGHTFAASGLVSLISLVQALRHGTIPASLHCEQENDYINWRESPFYVNKTKRPWPEAEGKTRTGVTRKTGAGITRMGAVSAFGMSGTNAHMVVRSYSADGGETSGEQAPYPYYLLAFSAGTEEALREKIQDMIDVFQNKNPEPSLSQISYTLLEGRQHFNHRCAIVIRDRENAVYALQQLEGKERLPNLFHGKVPRDFTGQKAIEQYAEDLLKQSRSVREDREKYREILYALAELYCQGYKIPWKKLFTDTISNTIPPRRVHLPGYPFAREHYWISGTDNGTIRTTDAAAFAWQHELHPLLHQNTSDFSEQRFSSTFTGREFFFKAHVVKGRRIFPGVASLEMARAAVEAAMGAIVADKAPDSSLETEKTEIRLKNVVWARPIAVEDQPIQIHIGLFPEENGEIAYEIFSVSGRGGSGAEPVVHGQGRALLNQVEEVPAHDLETLRARCNRVSLSAAQFYNAFRTIGFVYGPEFQGIESLYIGPGQVLAKLSLPSSILDTKDQYVLHPSMVDSALQASAGLMMDLPKNPSGNGNGTSLSIKPFLPFALQEIEIHAKCTATMWSVARYSDDGQEQLTHGNARTEKFDIDLCNEHGKVCIRLKGVATRALEDEMPTGTMISDTSTGAMAEAVMLAPVWDVAALEKIGDGEGELLPTPTHPVVIIGGSEDRQKAIQRFYPQARAIALQPDDTMDGISEKLAANGTINHIVWIAPEDSLGSLADQALIDEQNRGVLLAFRMIKSLLRLGYGSQELGWSIITTQTQPVFPNEPVNPTHACFHGLFGSLAKEYPHWKIRLIDLEINCEWPYGDIFRLPADPRGESWFYRGREWYRQKLVPVHWNPLERTIYRTGGVYVVIGGAGGIGEAWSEYLIRTYQARIVWIGRRPKDKTIQARLDRLATLGSAPHYIAADATDQNALRHAYEEIKQRYSGINGVIHSAIVLLDKSIGNMEEEQFRAGLSAKVDVSVRLAQVFQTEPLDFVVFFSSMMSFLKAGGQSNYAAGCTFKDAFAHQLGRQWPCTVKTINWGYWGSVGVVASKPYQDRMLQAGIGSIEPAEAMKALDLLLAGPMSRMGFMKTVKQMEGVDYGEPVTVYPESPAANIPGIWNPIPDESQIEPAHDMKLAIDPLRNEMDGLLGRLLWSQFRLMGLFEENTAEIAALKRNSGLLPVYDRWLEESIAVLARKHYLESDGLSYTVIDATPIDINAAWKEWERKKNAWLNDPNLKAQVIPVESTMRVLPDILKGKIPATDIMFPGSSLELVEGIYQNNPVADYFNEVAADTVVAYIRERINQDPSARIRIIEIGAGTGGTSSAVFRKLKPYRDYIGEYCYTDISRAFLMHAEKTYSPENPYLNYQIFNIESPVAGQNISPGGYDLAIGTNVLHATRNIRRTIRNTKAVLKKNGLLLLNEFTESTLFTHLTFGLLEGWWLYEDTALRIPGCPGLYPETWQTVLSAEGFRPVLFPAREAHCLGQQIIIAASDGVIRQKQPEIQSSLLSVKLGAPGNKLNGRSPQEKSSIFATRAVIGDSLREKSTAYIKKLVAETLKMPVDKIDSAAPLEKYGIDSILVVQLTNVLGKVFENIGSTLFFEFQTIDALTGYFLEFHKEALIRRVGLTDREDQPKADAGEEETRIAELPVMPKIASRRSRMGEWRRFPVNRDNQTSGKYLVPQSFSVQDVAVIGLSGRYPKSPNIQEFWKNLMEGNNCISEIPKDRWDWRDYYHDEKGIRGSIYTKWGGFIEGMDQFDPLFFQISPREATQMDPQERLFLEVAYESIEDAGYTPAGLSDGRKVGVFVGVMNGHYPAGSQYWSIANRVSYLLNFQGPSMAVDTACSSSLTAIHLALDSLYSGISECAIAGGVNLITAPVHYLNLAAMTMLSSGDQCRSFGDGADGFVDGEGVGAIVLKRLERAVADGDHIYGVIKGSMLNAGGKTNGYTVPNPNAQSELIASALQRTGVHPRTVSYVEAHGTGTALGDPIEIAGLARAFAQNTNDKQFCAIGSVKSNIGHCESAAGIAGLTKILLQLKNHQLVPSLHSRSLNPKIDFNKTPFTVQQELMEWKRPLVQLQGETREYPRRAGISSFGAGGANAHIVIEEYIPDTLEQPPGGIHPGNPAVPAVQGYAIIILSARNEERLNEQVRRILATIRERQFPENGLADMAYTLQVGREAMEERLAVMVGSVKELAKKLAGYLDGRNDVADLYRGQAKNREALAVFGTDEELQEAVKKWIERGKYSKLLDLWVKGLAIDWNKLYPDTGNTGSRPRRMSLPTYPFAKESYWIPERHGVSETGIQSSGRGVTATETPVELTRTQAPHPLPRPNTIIRPEPPFSSKLPQRSLKPLTEAGAAFPAVSGKPDGISLCSVSDGQNISGEPGGQPDGIIPAPSVTISSGRSGWNELPNPANPVQPAIDVESLREELAASLAEALYMKRSDLDPDKKFIDMGLDSIIGVEWIKTVNKRYEIAIPATKVYDYPTIREFTGFIAGELEKQHRRTSVSRIIPVPDKLPTGAPPRPELFRKRFSEESLREELAASLAEALYMKRSDLDLDKKFIDMGLDSIIGVEWIKTVNKQFGISIPATKVYDYPTIGEFARFLAKEMDHIPVSNPPSLEEILQQVQQGILNPVQAEQLYHQLHLVEEIR